MNEKREKILFHFLFLKRNIDVRRALPAPAYTFTHKQDTDELFKVNHSNNLFVCVLKLFNEA